jgi:hypothetical protein
MSGLLDDLVEASHISAGMNIGFGEALDLVRAAYEFAAIEEPTPPTTIGNVTYVDFRRR